MHTVRLLRWSSALQLAPNTLNVEERFGSNNRDNLITALLHFVVYYVLC